jgi:hypothetical protein
MRTDLALVCSLALAGCYSIAETHGDTAKAYSGAVPVTFTNASPDRVCHLYLSFEREDAYGDNWLPEAGLPSGQSVQFQVRPGTYKAKWSSCKDATDVKQQKLVATYAATMVHQNAVELTQPTQLFAFIATATAPTRFAPVKAHTRLVRFEGHATVISAELDTDRDR